MSLATLKSAIKQKSLAIENVKGIHLISLLMVCFLKEDPKAEESKEYLKLNCNL